VSVKGSPAGVTDKPRMPRQATALFIGIFLSVASNNLFTPLLPDIQHDLKQTATAIGAFVSAYGLARLVVDLPAGAFTNRFGPSKVVVAGVVLNVGGCVIGLVSGSFPLLVVGRVCSGVGAGLIATVGLAALSDLAPPEIRGRVMSLYQMANNLGIAAYPLLGGLVGVWFGWRTVFAVAAGLSLLTGLVLAPTLAAAGRAAAHATKKAASSVAAVPVSGRALAFAFAAIYAGVLVAMMNRHGFRNTVMPLYAGNDIGLSPVQTATGVTVMALISIAVTVPGAALGDRIGRRRIIVAGLLIIAGADVLFPVLAHNYPGFLVAAVIIGCGDFFASSQTAQLAELSDGKRRVLALSAYRFFVDLGALIGPLALSSVFGAGGLLPTMILMSALLVGAAVFIAICVPERSRKAV
jgi:MFS family permease